MSHNPKIPKPSPYEVLRGTLAGLRQMRDGLDKQIEEVESAMGLLDPKPVSLGDLMGDLDRELEDLFEKIGIGGGK